MIDLLYLSRTVVPAHLGELEQLDVLYRDEQVLVALDGVLTDAQGRRLSGPTLHDYLLLTGNRLLLWARDYGQHLCYTFPLEELDDVGGQGMDPLHAQIHLRLSAEGEPPQEFSLMLLPLADLPAALGLLRTAAATARACREAQLSAADSGGEVMAALSAQLYGDASTPVEPNPRWRQLGAPPYRWTPDSAQAASPGPASSSLEAAPEMVYTLGRIGRSAWDTLARTLRENELPFDLNGGDIRDITAMMRAANELLATLAVSPEARETVLEFMGGMGGAGRARSSQASRAPAPEHERPDEAEASAGASYREIPLRRTRPQASAECPQPQRPAAAPKPQRGSTPQPASDELAERGIPLRRHRKRSEEGLEEAR
jgi:hypothetical protein